MSMKKIILSLTFLAVLSLKCCEPGKQELDTIENILKRYDSSTIYSETFHRQLLAEIHTQCTNIPGICTKDRVTWKEIGLFTGLTMAAGAAIAYKLLQRLE